MNYEFCFWHADKYRSLLQVDTINLSLCVCVFIFFHHEGFFWLKDVEDMLERYGPMILCCEYSSGCFCQVPLSLFLNLSYFTSKDVTLARRKTVEKILWYTVLLQKDDIHIIIGYKVILIFSFFFIYHYLFS